MGRDTIQLETALSTISQEYLLEFTSEYGISEDVHPELPGLEERIVDLPKGKVGVYTKFFEFINFCIPISQFLFGILGHYQIHLSQLSVIGAVPLLTATASRVIDMEDPDAETESSGTPSAIEKSPLDFDNENPSSPMTEGKCTEDLAHETVAPEISLLRNMPATGVASEVSLEEEVPAMEPRLSKKKRTAATPRAKHDLVFRDSDRKCGYHGSARHALCGKCRVREIDLLLIHGWVTRRYLSARMRRDQQLQPGHPEHMPRCCRSHSTAGTQITGEERIKAAFEEFKKYEDDRVEKRCTEIDARLDALSIDFDEELYPHMLTAIAVSAGIAKGMSEGLAHGIEHGKAGRGLEVVEASAEGFKGCPNGGNHGVLHLESDSEEDAPKYIRDLRPSTSQLKIPVYPEVRDPRDPWAIKEEMLLEEAITANVSRAKKKRCRVGCRTSGIGFAHHVRSDGVPVSVPIVAPQGLAILLADAATQTETSEDDASPRLLRSKSLPPMYNLDWP
uniref:Transposase (Putative), gypsy type n=1 Tax=Tanacetum cinerariifolium TaxID=118510 RepID=A0A6L2JR94_TANCI|nr:hypothetical protein [Tanacetum cinerariifolium]